MSNTPMWLPLDDADAALENTGGKGSSLATMARAGLPVPQGFCLTASAYEAFVDDHDIQSIVSGVDVDDIGAVAEAARRIEANLDAREVPAAVVDAIEQGYATLGGAAVAVRSSATAEDLPQASFAGQMESFLNVRGGESIAAAVKRCWMSLWSDRAIDYRARNGLDSRDVSMAVVVQELVDAEAAGVMFTANPVTGSRDEIVINAAWGLGESVVNGTVSADTVVIDAADGAIIGRNIADKTVQTVRVQSGTRERPVDDDRRRAPVLADADARDLAAIGARVVQLYARPMDIEWARFGGRFTILQARPITNLDQTPDPREEWNDSHDGDYLWTASNVAEAVPDVMTPITWSMTKRHLSDAMAIPGVGEHSVCGNIGGRLYINYSVLLGVARAVGMGPVMRKAASLAFGEPPASMNVPPLPLSRWKILRLVLGDARKFSATVKTYQRNLDAYVAAFPGRCATTRALIADAAHAAELAAVFTDHVQPLITDAPRMLAAGGRVNGMALAKLRPWLRKFVDDADANALITGNHTAEESLASLGPLVGLRRLAAGDIDADTYITSWGHRGPHELELYEPRPAEDPQWLQTRLSDLKDAPDVDELLARQAVERDAALRRFDARYPGKSARLRRRMAHAAEAVRAREVTRSEAVRVAWVTREFVLRCGQVTGHGDALFFLDFDELLALLGGDASGLAHVPARRAAYDHYRTLPVYPTWIRGSFDPETWAADPHRRTDSFDATSTDTAVATTTDTIAGTAGSNGVVEGVARVLSDIAEAHRLDVGDILVTKITNIGWTPVFPRIGAVVTDIGATLSHASIVARE
ncbi:MAG: PEP/pyruvate-binding domain-containing protein, partial [Stackebrandtia sp.]